MQEIPAENLVKKGRMTKSVLNMTLAEKIRWQMQVQKDAKEFLFSIGQPLVYKENGQTIAEFSDGRKQRLR